MLQSDCLGHVLYDPKVHCDLHKAVQPDASEQCKVHSTLAAISICLKKRCCEPKKCIHCRPLMSLYWEKILNSACQNCALRLYITCSMPHHLRAFLCSVPDICLVSMSRLLSYFACFFG